MGAPHLVAAALLLAMVGAIIWGAIRAERTGRLPLRDAELDQRSDATLEGDGPKAAGAPRGGRPEAPGASPRRRDGAG